MHVLRKDDLEIEYPPTSLLWESFSRGKAVHKLGDEELTIEVDNLRKKLFELKTQGVTEKIQDTSQYGKIRKDIARLLSEQSTRSKAEKA